MATSIIRRLNLALPGIITGVHVPIKCGFHYRIVARDYKSGDRLIKHHFSPTLNYGSKAEVYTQDGKINIPVDRLTISYSRSGGPGGQHVNKVNTKAEIRFHVQTAEWIPDEARSKIIQRNKNRINKAGELLVTSEVSRSQQRNLEDCLQKISDIIAEANQKPHEPSAEDVAVRRARLEKMKKEMLKQKRLNSVKKQSRRVDFD